MEKQLKEFEFEIPFGAKDSELYYWEYTIPEGMEAIIVDNKIVVKKKENEDERIRQFLIHEVKETSDEIMSYRNMNKKDVLAWLEKRGENNMGISESVKQKLEDNLNKALETETPESWNKFLDEQKFANEVEPKFNVGDWVVFDNNHQSIYQVEKIEDWRYILRHTHGGTFRVCVLHDESLRLWTIQDAKDGDVLVKNSGRPFIFRGCLDKNYPNKPVAYCGIDSDDDFRVACGTNRWTDENVYPATKEQRDLLFQKMKEADYKWDANKKELKKIEQKSAWSEEDDKILKSIIINIENLQFSEDM